MDNIEVDDDFRRAVMHTLKLFAESDSVADDDRKVVIRVTGTTKLL